MGEVISLKERLELERQENIARAELLAAGLPPDALKRIEASLREQFAMDQKD